MGVFDRMKGLFGKGEEEDPFAQNEAGMPQFPASSTGATSLEQGTPPELMLNQPPGPPKVNEPSFVKPPVPLPPPPGQTPQPSPGGDKLEMISLKLDNIKNMLDSISHRLTLLEQKRRGY